MRAIVTEWECECVCGYVWMQMTMTEVNNNYIDIWRGRARQEYDARWLINDEHWGWTERAYAKCENERNE